MSGIILKMVLPDDYEEKLRAAKEKGGDRYAHLDVPELKDSKPRKRLGEEVVEQEVYGIDPFTYNLLLNTMPQDTHGFTDRQKQLFIEEVWALPSFFFLYVDTLTVYSVTFSLLCIIFFFCKIVRFNHLLDLSRHLMLRLPLDLSVSPFFPSL